MSMDRNEVKITGGSCKKVTFYEYIISINNIGNLGYPEAPIILKEGNITIILDNRNTEWLINLHYKGKVYRFEKTKVNSFVYNFCHIAHEKLPRKLITFINKLNLIEKLKK